ncbi:MAG: cysteine hydrolase [Gammaproteobacteria bacterium]|nr:cysteine hydrolase [Gammaproteobacteria bacterium]MCP5195419.1 cysteine hydrolase [Gammaproteobacteria bacterium]
MKQGLIVIDVQNDYFSGGAMELVEMDSAASNCAKLIDHFRKNEMPVFHVQHLSVRAGATFFVPNTHGCEIHESVRPNEDEALIIKNYPNSFRGTELSDRLKTKGVDEVIICGAMSHMCIDTTTRAAFDLGYKCQVISDACATRDMEFNGHIVKATDVHAAFMAALRVPFAEVLSTIEYLAAT